MNEGVVSDPRLQYRSWTYIGIELKNWPRFIDLKILLDRNFAPGFFTKGHITCAILKKEGSTFGFGLIFKKIMISNLSYPTTFWMTSFFILRSQGGKKIELKFGSKFLYLIFMKSQKISN